MTDEEAATIKRVVEDAMQKAARVVRDECVKCIRQFGGRISNEELASVVERMPLPCEPLPREKV
jgi:hypothetical protein